MGGGEVSSMRMRAHECQLPPHGVNVMPRTCLARRDLWLQRGATSRSSPASNACTLRAMAPTLLADLGIVSTTATSPHARGVPPSAARSASAAAAASASDASSCARRRSAARAALSMRAAKVSDREGDSGMERESDCSATHFCCSTSAALLSAFSAGRTAAALVALAMARRTCVRRSGGGVSREASQPPCAAGGRRRSFRCPRPLAQPPSLSEAPHAVRSARIARGVRESAAQARTGSQRAPETAAGRRRRRQPHSPPPPRRPRALAACGGLRQRPRRERGGGGARSQGLARARARARVARMNPTLN